MALPVGVYSLECNNNDNTHPCRYDRGRKLDLIIILDIFISYTESIDCIENQNCILARVFVNISPPPAMWM